MTTIVEIFHDEESVADGSPIAVEVIQGGFQTMTYDPASGKPFAIMRGLGRNIYVSPTPPVAGEYIGDIWIPLP